MRILFLSLAVPFPCTNGQRIRNGSIVKALAEEGHEVSLIAFAEPEDLGLKGLCLETCRTVTFVPVPAGGHSSQSYGRRLRALGSLRPYGALWRPDTDHRGDPRQRRDRVRRCVCV